MHARDEIIDSNMLSLDHADRGEEAPGPAAAGNPTPQWAEVYRTALQNHEGYAYAVARNGEIIEQAEVNLTRSRYESQNPSTHWTATSRLNLASVSKIVTAVAIMQLVQDGRCRLDEPFYPYIRSKVPEIDPSIKVVTLANLLTMRSGMVPNGALSGDLWAYLTQYLKQPIVGKPGITYRYSNANFTILQAVVDQITSGQYSDFVDYVTKTILGPMGIDPKLFNPVPDAQDVASLAHSNATDSSPGKYWPPLTFVGPAGWIAPVGEILKFLIAVRTNTVLTPAVTDQMLQGELGWYTFNGKFGQYYHHNGGLFTGQPRKDLQTGVIRLTNGYDAVLLTNSGPQIRIIRVMVQAFQASPDSPLN